MEPSRRWSQTGAISKMVKLVEEKKGKRLLLNSNADSSLDAYSSSILSAVASIVSGVTEDALSVADETKQPVVKDSPSLNVPQNKSKKKKKKIKATQLTRRSKISLVKLSTSKTNSSSLIQVKKNSSTVREMSTNTIQSRTVVMKNKKKDEEEEMNNEAIEGGIVESSSCPVTTTMSQNKVMGVDESTELTEPKDSKFVIGSGTRIPLPIPLPKSPNQLDVNIYLGRVNSYINKLGYHHNGEPSIRVMTHLSLRHHMATARQIIKAGENIKCLHALLLGIYFTNCTPLIERFPINFKSKFNGKEFRHVVLGIYLYGAYGALGISRDPGLQDKPPHHPRLSDLLTDYVISYSHSGHVLMEIKVGGVILRDMSSLCGIPWKVGQILYMANFKDIQQFALEADRVSRLLKVEMGQTCIRHVRGPPEMNMPKCLMEDPEALMQVNGTTATLIKDKLKMIHDMRVAATTAAASTSKSLTPASRSSLPTKSTLSKTKKPKKKKVLKYKRFAEP